MDVRITVDDRTLRSAIEITGLKDPAAVIAHVLERFVREDAVRSLIARGGTDPTASAPPRRRPPSFRSDEAEGMNGSQG